MQQMGWSVTFMADMIAPAHLGATKIGGIEFFTDKIENLPNWLRAHGDSIEAVWLSRFQTALKHAPLIRALAPGTPIIFDTVDLHFLREQRRLLSEFNPLAETISTRIRDMEIQASLLTDTTVVVSKAEHETFVSIAPNAKIAVLGNIHAPINPEDVTGFDQRSGLLFIGGMQHAPNLDALRWLSTGLFDAIRARMPDIKLHVIGTITEDQRMQFQSEGIVFHGHVSTLDPWLSGCRISIAPLRIGAGVKGKINSAMSHGLPVVATSIAAEGMHLTAGDDVLIADTVDTLSESVARLYNDAELWNRLSKGGLHNVEQHYSRSFAKNALQHIFNAIISKNGSS